MFELFSNFIKKYICCCFKKESLTTNSSAIFDSNEPDEQRKDNLTIFPEDDDYVKHVNENNKTFTVLDPNVEKNIELNSIVYSSTSNLKEAFL